jgi:hypothetical protein
VIVVHGADQVLAAEHQEERVEESDEASVGAQLAARLRQEDAVLQIPLKPSLGKAVGQA